MKSLWAILLFVSCSGKLSSTKLLSFVRTGTTQESVYLNMGKPSGEGAGAAGEVFWWYHDDYHACRIVFVNEKSLGPAECQSKENS